MTYYFDLFGCVKNQVDAENMMALLNGEGWTAAGDAKDADLIIVNSCGFIESAKRESINAVLAWRKFYPTKKILLAGCLAQRYAGELSASLPEADGLFGTDNLAGIVEAAAKMTPGASVCAAPAETRSNRPGSAAIDNIPASGSGGIAPAAGEKALPAGSRAGKRPLLSLPGSAYVKISEGCDNHCSFCAIPLIRGKLKSRAIRDVAGECKALAGRGIKELCLIGQDTGSYGRDRPGSSSSSGLADLLEALSRLEGNFRVRLLYIHPDHFPLSILDIMEQDRRFLPYFDIPFQHGSEKILRAMNRRGSAGTYLELIETIRRRFEDAVIRSTFMTGFPGETEEDFTLLLDFQENARLDWLGCFAYSREENTSAYTMKGRVAKKTAAERKRIVEEQQIPITEERMDRFIGRTFDVLVEEKFSEAAVDYPPQNITSPPAGFLAARTSSPAAFPPPDPSRAGVGAPAAGSSPFDEDAAGETAFYLGRLPSQAPEVDGATVLLSGRPLKLGTLVPCRIIARRGFDLEARPEG